MKIMQLAKSMKTPKLSSDFKILATYFLIVLVFLFVRKGGLEHPQYYDASYYVGLSQSFLKHHHWSFLNFPNTYRGYFFPFILNFLEPFFNITACAILINTLSLFLLSFFIIPNLSISLFARPFSRAKSIAFSLIFLYFWVGYFYYVLTDIIAITLLFLAMVLASKKNYWCLFLGGMAIAAAFNIRPIYQLNLVLFILYFIWLMFTKNIKLRGFISFLCGVIILLTPQLIINHHNNDSFSPFVITDSYKNTGKGSLYLMQMKLGLKVEKYETYIGDLSKYPSPAVVYTSGDDFYKQYQQSYMQKNLSSYVRFALLNPVKMSQIYLIHLFNGLDIKTNTVYISKIRDLLSCSLISILNYIILTFGFINLILNFKSTPNEISTRKNKWFFCANIFLPVLFVLPVAVEIRFFLPLFILLYLSFLQFTCFSNWQNKKSFFAYLFVAGLLFVGACFASNAMSKHIVYDPNYINTLLN